MSIFNIYSKRIKKLKDKEIDIYSYDKIPNKLKVQIILCIQCFNKKIEFDPNLSNFDSVCEEIHNILKKEYGVFSLYNNNLMDDREQIEKFLFEDVDVNKNLDVIELLLNYIDYVCRTTVLDDNVKYGKEAIDEINERFKENGIGYSYTNGKIIRVDSTYIHNEVTKPTINLLSNEYFVGANEEYLKAHEYYKKGENKECLINCCKAFESVMKTICKYKNWKFDDSKDASKKLIKILLNNNFVPQYYQEQLSSLANLLESGIPTIRNKTSGHGQGDTIKTVDEHIARYVLNLTGANIIFLIEQSGIK